MKLDPLVILADELDSKGLKAEADRLDTILAEIGSRIVLAQDEKKERQTSKKVMSIFRRLKEAAEKACDADIDTRGPYRILFDKARFEAQTICELLKEIEFTPEGEQKAVEEGQVQQNLADANQQTATDTSQPAAATPAIPVTTAPISGVTPVAAPVTLPEVEMIPVGT